MKPGRELDALVAEHVMNWRPTMHPLSRPRPFYSTDIAAAWTVDKPDWLWRFQEMNQILAVTLYPSLTLEIKAARMYPRLPEETILIRHPWLDDKAQTYAWLRCLAALKAAGVEVDDGK